MDCEQDKKRMNVADDRLSNLPDDLIHKILSFIDIKHAIKTSSLSSRWRFIWTSMPYLNFSIGDFEMLPKFSKFVTRVLSGRNNQIDVSSVELSFRGKASQVFVKKLLNYAFSHNVQQLAVNCLNDKKDTDFPLSIFSSQSLKHLSLTHDSMHYITLTSTCALPALTTLYLDGVTLYDESIGLLSNCPNLKNLTINFCQMDGMNGLVIRHSRLSNLTLKFIYCYVNVDTPQLKNLSVKQHDFSSSRSLQFSAGGVPSLEKVNLCINHPSNARHIVALLQHFHSVKFFTLNLETVEILSSSVELISHQPSPFANLKILKIYPATKILNDSRKSVNITAKVLNYLLDSSPDVTFAIVSREEILAQKLMGELEVFLKCQKTNSDTNTAQTGEGESENDPETNMQEHLGKRMSQIETYWKDLNEQLKAGNSKTSQIISMLRPIEKVLSAVPTSKKTLLQARFSSLYAKADNVMHNMIDCMKIKCDKKPSRLNFNIHALDTTSQPSS